MLEQSDHSLYAGFAPAFSGEKRQVIWNALQEFNRFWAAAYPEVAASLSSLQSDAGFREFVIRTFDGRERYDSDLTFKNRDVSHAFREEFMSLLGTIGNAFDKWLECIDSPSFLLTGGTCGSFSQLLLVLEGLLNASLLRWRDETLPSSGFSAMAVYAGSPVEFVTARSRSANGFRLFIGVSGISLQLNALGNSEIGDGAIANRRYSLVGNREFSFSRPFAAPSSYLLGVAPADGLLNTICPFLRGQRNPLFKDGAGVIVSLRLVQREACLLTEEWEFNNAVLAVDYTTARTLLNRQVNPESADSGSSENSGSPMAMLAAVFQRRDELGLWYAASLADLQSYLLQVSSTNYVRTPLAGGLDNDDGFEAADIKQELDAARSVLLAALQKLYLPASVSRHDYDPVVFAQAARFTRAQALVSPDDIAARLSRLTLECAIESIPGAPAVGESRLAPHLAHLKMESFEERCLVLVRYLEQEASINWVLSFDPTPSMKAVSWLIAPGHYLLLVLCFTLALARKSLRGGARLDADWSAVLVSLLQMPDSFPQIRQSELDRRRDAINDDNVVLYEIVQRLCDSSMNWISNETIEGMSGSYLQYWSQLTKERLAELSKVAAKNLQRDRP
jgi:hypothetical protein